MEIVFITGEDTSRRLKFTAEYATIMKDKGRKVDIVEEKQVITHFAKDLSWSSVEERELIVSKIKEVILQLVDKYYKKKSTDLLIISGVFEEADEKRYKTWLGKKRCKVSTIQVASIRDRIRMAVEAKAVPVWCNYEQYNTGKRNKIEKSNSLFLEESLENNIGMHFSIGETTRTEEIAGIFVINQMRRDIPRSYESKKGCIVINEPNITKPIHLNKTPVNKIILECDSSIVAEQAFIAECDTEVIIYCKGHKLYVESTGEKCPCIGAFTAKRQYTDKDDVPKVHGVSFCDGVVEMHKKVMDSPFIGNFGEKRIVKVDARTSEVTRTCGDDVISEPVLVSLDITGPVKDLFLYKDSTERYMNDQVSAKLLLRKIEHKVPATVLSNFISYEGAVWLYEYEHEFMTDKVAIEYALTPYYDENPSNARNAFIIGETKIPEEVLCSPDYDRLKIFYITGALTEVRMSSEGLEFTKDVKAGLEDYRKTHSEKAFRELLRGVPELYDEFFSSIDDI